MINFESYYKKNKKSKSKKKKEENNETQINDPYSDSDLSTKPPPFNKKKTFLFPPNYGMGEGQYLTPKPPTFSEMMDMTVGYNKGPNKRVVIIYPGKFQPFYLAHAQIYNKLKKAYPQAELFIATPGSTNPSNAPFNFEDKQQLILASGVDPKVSIEVMQPYTAPEIINKYNKKETILIFAVPNTLIDAYYLMNPYYQKFKSIEQCQPVSEHAYVMPLPNVKTVPSKTILDEYRNSDENRRRVIIMDLYHHFKPEVFKLFNEKII